MKLQNVMCGVGLTLAVGLSQTQAQVPPRRTGTLPPNAVRPARKMPAHFAHIKTSSDGSQVYIEGALLAGATPLAGASVEFRAAGSNATIPTTTTTDASGYFHLSVTAAAAPLFRGQLSFAGDEQHQSARWIVAVKTQAKPSGAIIPWASGIDRKATGRVTATGSAQSPASHVKPQQKPNTGWHHRVAAGARVNSRAVMTALQGHPRLTGSSMARQSRFVVVARPSSARHPRNSMTFSVYDRARQQFKARVVVHPRVGRPVSIAGHVMATRQLVAMMDDDLNNKNTSANNDGASSAGNPELPDPGADNNTPPTDNTDDSGAPTIDDPGTESNGSPLASANPVDPNAGANTSPAAGGGDVPPAQTGGSAPPEQGGDTPPEQGGGEVPESGTPPSGGANPPTIPPQQPRPNRPIPPGELQPESKASEQFVIRLNDPVGPRGARVSLIATVIDRATNKPAAGVPVTLRIAWPGKPIPQNRGARVYIKVVVTTNASGKAQWIWQIPASAAVYYPFLHVSTKEGATAMTRIRIGQK